MHHSLDLSDGDEKVVSERQTKLTKMKGTMLRLKVGVVEGIKGRRDGTHTYLFAKSLPKETGGGNPGWGFLLSEQSQRVPFTASLPIYFNTLFPLQTTP